MKALIAVLALTLLFATSSMAAEHPHGRFGYVAALKAHGALVMQVVDISIQTNTIPDESDDLASLNEEFRKAVGQAHGHADLTGALKNYYGALRAFLTGLQPQDGEATIVYRARISNLETQAKSAGERLGVELQTLGVDS